MANDRVVTAVNYLIDTPDYSALAQEMTSTLENWRTRPLQYAGKLACLNAMLDVGLSNRDAFEKLLHLVEAKRMENPRVNKRDYQRNLMRERRKRMAKALLLHEARSGPLKGETRTAMMAAIRHRWDKAKAEHLTAREIGSAAERLEAIREFWATVDRQLDANIASMHKTSAVA